MASRLQNAFTLVEMLVVLLVIAGLILFTLPPPNRRARETAKRVVCGANLRQVGLAFRTWSTDNSDTYPMATTNNGGTESFIGTGLVYPHFRALSNELVTPKILVCPSDGAKVAITNWSKDFGDTNVSYFIGVDAKEVWPQAFLSGDRNLAFEGQDLRPGLFLLVTNKAALSWTKAVHGSTGWICTADGSVNFYRSERTALAAQQQGIATNRLVIP
jgi:prepilin-type N-terminal cleavage/methylation domain-containing protein